MKNEINYILENYLKAKTEEFKNHSIANHIRNVPSKDIQNLAHLDSKKYLVTGSPGQGNWAGVPWIAVFDTDITDSAEEGYDIVYLFCADMSGVYLSLNQGWTYFKNKYGMKEGKAKIKIVSEAWKKRLSSQLSDFPVKTIDLKAEDLKSNLPEGYELGHICGKFYEARNIPEDNVLIDDLRNLLGVYRELKGKMIEGSIEKTNDLIIVESTFENVRNFDEDSFEEVAGVIENQQRMQLEEDDAPEGRESYPKTKYKFGASNSTDFEKKNKNQARLGLAGELMVLNSEKKTLEDNGLPDLAKKVKHVSVEDGDGAGYDILSYDLNGNKKYIEVKTTKGDKDEPYFITRRELVFSKLHFANYYLYRVFNFNPQKGTGKYYKINGNLIEQLFLIPEQFKVPCIKKSSSK